MKSKYIIVYSNNIKDKLFINKLYDKFKLKIYIFQYYFNNNVDENTIDENTIDENIIDENTIDENIIDNEKYEIIYVDNYIEELYVKNVEYIFYLNNAEINNNLINLVIEYNKKNVFYKINENIINNQEFELLELEIFNKYLLKLDTIEDIEIKNKVEKNNILNKVNINLLVSRKNINIKQGIVIITYFKKTDIKILDIIQKKCIFENLKNTNISKIMIVGDNIQEEFKNIAETNSVNNFGNMMFYQSSENNSSFGDLINISNKLFSDKIICIIRSDIILLNQSNLNDIEIDLISDENQIFALSRTERLINGNLVKCDKLNRILYSTEQDAWIFKAPLNLNNADLNNLYFYNKYSHLFFNKILKNNNYNIINNSKKYKIIRILHENNLDSRLLFDNINNSSNENIKIKDLDSIYLLPDNEILDKISFEQLVKLAQIDENELYKIKCSIFDKYLKNKIFNNL